MRQSTTPVFHALRRMPGIYIIRNALEIKEITKRHSTTDFFTNSNNQYIILASPVTQDTKGFQQPGGNLLVGR
jgi:hypothetical protein